MAFAEQHTVVPAQVRQGCRWQRGHGAADRCYVVLVYGRGFHREPDACMVRLSACAYAAGALAVALSVTVAVVVSFMGGGSASVGGSDAHARSGSSSWTHAWYASDPVQTGRGKGRGSSTGCGDRSCVGVRDGGCSSVVAVVVVVAVMA